MIHKSIMYFCSTRHSFYGLNLLCAEAEICNAQVRVLTRRYSCKKQLSQILYASTCTCLVNQNIICDHVSDGYPTQSLPRYLAINFSQRSAIIFGPSVFYATTLQSINIRLYIIKMLQTTFLLDRLWTCVITVVTSFR